MAAAKRGLFFAALVLLLVIVLLPAGFILTISTGDGARRAAFPLREGETFRIRFIHSLYHVPQTETWKVSKGSLELEEVRFHNFAAAEYYSPTLPYSKEGGEWIYRPRDHKPFTSIPVRVGYIANHTLLWRGKEFLLANFIPPGDEAVFQVGRRPGIYVLLADWFNKF